jgi:hypothetical protein
MKFVLRYSGELKGNARPAEKEVIRQFLSPQLENLWSTDSRLEGILINSADNETKYGHPNPFVRLLSGRKNTCLITEFAGGLVDLDILFLRPGIPGRLRDQTGDLDNRIKTLLDGLRPAQTEAEMVELAGANSPIFVLFEDDKLISSLRIRSEALLTHPKESSYVELIITVRTVSTKGNFMSLMYQ